MGWDYVIGRRETVFIRSFGRQLLPCIHRYITDVILNSKWIEVVNNLKGCDNHLNQSMRRRLHHAFTHGMSSSSSVIAKPGHLQIVPCKLQLRRVACSDPYIGLLIYSFCVLIFIHQAKVTVEINTKFTCIIWHTHYSVMFETANVCGFGTDSAVDGTFLFIYLNSIAALKPMEYNGKYRRNSEECCNLMKWLSKN